MALIISKKSWMFWTFYFAERCEEVNEAAADNQKVFFHVEKINIKLVVRVEMESGL